MLLIAKVDSEGRGWDRLHLRTKVSPPGFVFFEVRGCRCQGGESEARRLSIIQWGTRWAELQRLLELNGALIGRWVFLPSTKCPTHSGWWIFHDIDISIYIYIYMADLCWTKITKMIWNWLSSMDRPFPVWDMVWWLQISFWWSFVQVDSKMNSPC